MEIKSGARVELTDQELVAEALGGAAAAWEVLFDRHQASVRSLLNCRNAAMADDILQEAFIKAYLNLDKYNPDYSFVGWLWVIARNLLVDHTRRTPKIDEWQDLAGAAVARVASSAQNPEEQAISAQNRLNLERALEALDAPYKEVLVLRFWHDLSYEVIAERLVIPLGTVKTRIHRARAALIALL